MNYKIKNGLKVYQLPNEICQKMFKMVNEYLPNSYPVGNKVASVVLTATGKFYPGVSYHTQIMSLTMHAEAVALGNAATYGEKEITAITGPNCHACKQIIWESSIHSGIDIIILLKETDQIKQIPISEMMLYAWPENKWATE